MDDILKSSIYPQFCQPIKQFGVICNLHFLEATPLLYLSCLTELFLLVILFVQHYSSLLLISDSSSQQLCKTNIIEIENEVMKYQQNQPMATTNPQITVGLQCLPVISMDHLELIKLVMNEWKLVIKLVMNYNQILPFLNILYSKCFTTLLRFKTSF